MTAVLALETNAARPDAARSTCETARQVAAVCSSAEAGRVRALLQERLGDTDRAAVLWLTWVQWRAMGREMMLRETDLSLWTVTCRLRQLREAGIVVPSWTRELDLLACGQFHAHWDAERN